MIELSLFGLLLGTLASSLSVVLLIVALTSATYVAMTLITAMRVQKGLLGLPLPASAERRVRVLGLSAALVCAGVALVGLRVGSAGSGGEIVPTLAVIIAGAAALGGAAACALTFTARATLALAQARAQREKALAERARDEARRLHAHAQRLLAGDDLRDELASAEAALDRLRGALAALDAEQRGLAEKLTAASEEGTLAADMRRTLDEMTMKLELGQRILATAEETTFRLSCSEPLRRLLRRRPRAATVDLQRVDDRGASMTPTMVALSSFVGEIREARRALDLLENKRPRGIRPGADEDPLTLARRDLDALEDAYAAVLTRVEVLRARRSAEATMEQVADAVIAVSASAKGLSADQAEIEALASEVTRAEAAVAMATPSTSDVNVLTATLARCTAALGRSDTTSLDELLKELRAIV